MNKSSNVRSVTEGDLLMLLQWRNNPDVRRFMLTRHEISFEEHRNWYEKTTQDLTHRLLIIEDTHQPIGYVHFSQVAEGGVSNWGFYVRPGAPKGTGRKLGIAALNYGFSNLMLHKICGQAIDSNCASIAFHKILGFQHEGLLRDQEIIDGDYHSLYFFGLLAHEWKSKNLLEKDTYVED